MNLELRQITSKLSPRGWLAVGAAALIGVIFVYALMTLASAPSYTTLVAGESPSQAAKITSALSTAGIQYQLQNSGTAIAVQSSQVGQARDTLGTQGLLVGGNSGQSLMSLIGSQSLGASQQQQQEQLQSALELQLQNTIEQMAGINAAQVQLAIPDQANTLFTGINTPTTASVLLNTTGTLDSSEVRSIANTVANAVPGLSVNKVTISDQNGDFLWPGAGTNTGGLTPKQAAQNAYDSQIAQQADAYLAETIGPDKAMVQINANVNMNQQTISSVTYAKKGTPLNVTTTKERLKGNGALAGAAGNNATKLATYAGTNAGTTTYSNNTSTVQEGVSKTVSQSTITPGAVTRQTISVLVNSNVPASELPAIRAAVENQVGFLKGRDVISINQVAFAKQTTVAAASTGPGLGDIKYVLVGLGSVLFLLFVSRLLRRRETENFAGQPTWLRELETPRSLAELENQAHMVDFDSPTAVPRLRSPVNLAKQQVEELVDRDPERVAAQIRQWMTED